jgi:hypothetical protein
MDKEESYCFLLNFTEPKRMIIIEHTICRLKKYRIQSEVFRYKLRRYNKVSDVVSELVNYRIINQYHLNRTNINLCNEVNRPNCTRDLISQCAAFQIVTLKNIWFGGNCLEILYGYKITIITRF